MKSLNRKFLIEAAVAVAVIAAGAFAFMQYRQNAGPDAAMPDPNVVAPAGIVTAISADSITIRRQQDDVQKAFAVGPATLVVSQVAAGETGKGLSDIKAGDLVMLSPSPSNPSMIDSIQVSSAGSAMPAAPASAPSGPPVSLMGTVVTASPSMLVVKPQDPGAENVQVTVTSDTAIRSNVLAGQKGKTFADIKAGTAVFVAGTTGSGSGITANIVQVLVPISELAQ